MNIYISANLYQNDEFENVFTILERLGDERIGIEIFPLWHKPEFEATLWKNMGRLKNVPVSFHGPYYFAEHSEPKGTLIYERARECWQKTFEYAEELNSKYIVFHHNNWQVISGKKAEMAANAAANLRELNDLARQYNTKIVVENVGIIAQKNLLFNEREFIGIFDAIDNKCLIDIGHAHCNGWDLENVLAKLANKIVSFHLHNNYGILDEHNRIHDGTLDINAFFKAYRQFTPNADLVMEYSEKFSRDNEGIYADIQAIQELISTDIGMDKDQNDFYHHQWIGV
jgi:sugar phosphate isomerase/epimerase